jgi:tetratricopeptide (TPR) repeat protein
LRLDKTIADAYKKRAIYEQELKQWENSVDDLNAVLKLTPDAVAINRIRAISYFYLGRYDESVADFTRYLRQDSTNNEARGSRGMAYLKTKTPMKGFVDLAASGNHNALDFKKIQRLADSLLVAKDTAELLHSLEVITDHVSYFTEGFALRFKLHMARKEWKPVEENVTRALRMSRRDAPKSSHSYLLTVQALAYSRHNHTEDALNTLGEAIKFDKKNDLAYLERARLFLAMGKSSKATADLTIASTLGNQTAKQMLASMK